jgi:hypothetical protein
MHITFFLVKWSNSQTFFKDTILNFLLINLAKWEFFTNFALSESKTVRQPLLRLTRTFAFVRRF